MGEKIIGLRQQLHFLERGEREREVGYHRFVTRDTEKRYATRFRVSRPQQSTRLRRRRRPRRRLENACTYVAGRAQKGLEGWKGRREREIFLWNSLEGNSPYPVENSFSFLAAFHISSTFSIAPPPFRRVKPLRVLYPMSTRLSVFPFFLSFFFLLSPLLFGRILSIRRV